MCNICYCIRINIWLCILCTTRHQTRLKILITKNTRDQIYHYAAYHKEKKMYKAIDKIKEEFESGKRTKQETLFE